jgi:signal transduction histidine kinase
VDKTRSFAWTIVVFTAAIITLQIVGDPFPAPDPVVILFWIVFLAAIDLLPVTLGYGTEVTMAFPIHLALAIIFRHEPWIAMMIAAIGAFDLREVRREIPLHRSLFNRSQYALALGASALPFTVFADDSTPYNLLLISASAILHLLVNTSLVTLAIHFERNVPLRQGFPALFPKPITGFIASYMLLTGLGTVTAIAHERAGQWAVAAILIPLLFARISIIGARAQAELSERVQRQQQALLDATEKVFAEREDERKRIAADIHDSSLQMLAAASYGCANAGEFFAAGHQDAAIQAVNGARDAIDEAMRGLRESLVDLRKSAVEHGGLVTTIEKFADQVGTLWGAQVQIVGELHIEPPIPVALAAFQILQEGLVNALKHAQTGEVTVRIADEDGQVHIVVEDKGPGFDTDAEVGEDHVGMKLMRERAERVGGRLLLESQPGAGTRLEAILPGGVTT